MTNEYTSDHFLFDVRNSKVQIIFEWNVDIMKMVCYFYIVAQKQAGRRREGRKGCRIGAWINWIMMFALFLTETSGCWLLQAFQKDEGGKIYLLVYQIPGKELYKSVE